MNINRFKILLSIHSLLEYLEIKKYGAVTNHGKRTAYIALKLGKALQLNNEDLHELGVYALLHDIGEVHDSFNNLVSLSDRTSLENSQLHCLVGEEIFINLTYFKNKNIIKYHHDKVDGSGFFHLKGKEIPILSQIIHLAGTFATFFTKPQYKDCTEFIIKTLNSMSRVYFDPLLVETLSSIVKNEAFRLDLQSINIDYALLKHFPLQNQNSDSNDFLNIVKYILSFRQQKPKKGYKPAF